MSAPSKSTTSPSPCACTNISLMQLFHELKQKFPGVPDHVVSNTIELYCHDKQACETHLHSEVKASLTHAYHASSSAAARKLSESKINLPAKCRNQPIVKHEISKATAVKSIICQEPMTAVLNSIPAVNEKEDLIINTDANQNVVEPEIILKDKIKNNITSPVTVINIDNCYAKYSAESPSDLELTNENIKDTVNTLAESKFEQLESTNYRIIKSNKIKCNLNEQLELIKAKEKKTIKKDEEKPQITQDKPNRISTLELCNLNEQLELIKAKEKKTIKKDEEKPQITQDKPKRPSTLEFLKPNPEVAFKPTSKEPELCRTVSPAPSIQKQDSQPIKETAPSGIFRSERGYPLNLSVNVNCHMDLSRPYGDSWLEDYESPRAITSVNLTVCTPTSNMASPVRDPRERREDDGFEGHVTVTVSPSTGRAPRRPAPPPPSQPSRLVSDPQRPTRVAPEPPEQPHERSLIERQKERLGRLARALAQERGRLAQLTRETQILTAPPPSAVATQRLRDYVERLRDQCDTLAKRLEIVGNEREESSFYSNIYTGQRPPASWQCHMCTFRNHPLLDKCEECDMPRIFVGTSLTRTHDSGFGSFRDSNRNKTDSQVNITEITDTGTAVSNIVEECRSLPQLNY